MKKLSILLFAFVALISFNACTSDDDILFVAQPDPEGIEFTNNFADVYTLTASTRNSLSERFVWTNVDFDAPTTVTYELQGSTDADFTVVDVLGSTGGNNLGVTVGQKLSLAEDAGLDNDPTTEEPNSGELYFRVRAYAGTGDGNALEEYSEVKNLSVELPESGEEAEPAKLNLYLVGDASAAGWDPGNNNTPLFRDSEDENIYYYKGYFNAGAFKLVTTIGQWAPMYGVDGDFLQFRETEADPDPASFEVSTAGYYSLTVNIDEMTYTWEEYDASTATTYNVIGLVGDGTTVGWPGDDNPTPDIQLTQSSHDDHIWYTENVELNGKSAKFRANLAWDKGWAGPFPSGKGGNDGDITTVAGTYNVWFNDLDGRYIFIPVVTE